MEEVMTLNLSVPKIENNLAPRITVIGVGGAGGNAVNNMIQSNVEGVDFMIANTDAQALGLSLCERRIQMGRNITQGLGAGSRPDIGRAAAEEQLDDILAELDGANMVFITAGMGGGTGTGAAPVIARAAREAGILTVGVVTKPFQFEGVHRMRMAEAGISEMTQYVDTLIVIPNQNLFRVANEKTTFADAFKMADDVLRSGVRGVTDLMVMPGLINLDFADIRSVMTEMGKAMMGTGEAEGDSRALAAAEAAISNPLLDEVSMKGARGVLINISGGMDLTLFEVDEAANRIRDEVDPDANIIFGAIFDQSLEGRMRVSVVATGIEVEMAEAQPPSPAPLSLVSNRSVSRPVSRPAARTGGAVRATATAAAIYEADESQVEMMAEPEAELAEPEVMEEAEVEAPTMTESPVEAAPMAAPVAAPAKPFGNRLFAYSQSVASKEPTAGSGEAAARRDSFIAPRPVQAETTEEAPAEAPAARSADPFAAAALSNGSRAHPSADSTSASERPSLGFDRKKAQRLFANFTEGAARALSATTQSSEARDHARAEPSLQERQQETRRNPESAAPAATRPAAQSAAQPSLAGLDSAGPSERSRDEEDFLDIPAFLRRQAN
jgi:cell division protein FtsZ